MTPTLPRFGVSGHAGAVHRVRTVAVRVVVTAVMLAVLGYEIQWLAPHIADAGHALSHPRWGWVALAVWAELSSMVAFARLQRIMLRPGGLRVSLRQAVSVAFAANAMSVTLPGGSVISSAWTYRRMRSWGASNPLVSFGLVASGVLSTLAFAVIGVLGTTLAGSHPSPWTLIAEISVAALVAVLLRRLIRRPDLLLRIAHTGLGWMNRARRRPPEAGRDGIQQLLDELVLIKPRRRDWLFGAGFAALNWLLDLICLIASCRAVGIHGHLFGVAIIAYVAGMAASSLSLLPGGLGVVDGALILGLTHGGLPTGPATAAVLVYRLISLVLVALIGWATWLLLQHSAHRRPRAPPLGDYHRSAPERRRGTHVSIVSPTEMPFEFDRTGFGTH